MAEWASLSRLSDTVEYAQALMFHIALHQPQIAPNTGNIMRLIANNGCSLHIIQPMGFELEERKLRRAGLDYRDLERLTLHPNFNNFLRWSGERRILGLTTKGQQSHSSISYQPEDILLFGSETSGLPDAILELIPSAQRLRIPMLPNNRSMNLSNAVAIVSYEAWRQNSYRGATAPAAAE